MSMALPSRPVPLPSPPADFTPALSYLGSVLFFLAVSIPAALITNVLELPTLGTLLDPTCRLTILILVPDPMTPVEADTILAGLQNPILANRLLWVGIASAILALTWRLLPPLNRPVQDPV